MIRCPQREGMMELRNKKDKLGKTRLLVLVAYVDTLRCTPWFQPYLKWWQELWLDRMSTSKFDRWCTIVLYKLIKKHHLKHGVLLWITNSARSSQREDSDRIFGPLRHLVTRLGLIESDIVRCEYFESVSCGDLYIHTHWAHCFICSCFNMCIFVLEFCDGHGFIIWKIERFVLLCSMMFLVQLNIRSFLFRGSVGGYRCFERTV